MADIKTTDLTLYFVRHAEKQVLAGERDPELTPQGVQRTEALADKMSSIKLSAVFSTDYRRTRNTARPTAQRQNLDIQLYDAGKSSEFVTTLLQQAPTGHYLIVGHSNTLPAMLRAAGVKELATEFDESLYGELYVVEMNSGATTLHKQRFGP